MIAMPMSKRQKPLPDPEEQRIAALMGPRELKPKGSPEWCWQTIELLKSYWATKSFADREWEKVRSEIREYRAWEKVPPGHPYGTEDALFHAEIGVSVQEATETIKALAEQATPLAQHGGDRKSEERENQGTERTLIRGETSAYLTRRIARDRPDILERMKQGEYKSVRAAAREAGIVKEPTALALLRKAWRKASAEERRAFHDWLHENVEA